jgi:hypothetical protein
MNHNQRIRIGLRDQARHRVRVATRWTAVASGVLAAAFAVALTHYDATAAPHSSTTPVTPQATTGNSEQNPGQNPGFSLQPPAQAPSVGFSGGYGVDGSSGGS